MLDELINIVAKSLGIRSTNPPDNALKLVKFMRNETNLFVQTWEGFACFML